MTTLNPQVVCAAIRRIRMQQCTDSRIPAEVSRYIKAERLMKETHWPGYVVSITDAGLEYLDRHEGTECE